MIEAIYLIGVLVAYILIRNDRRKVAWDNYDWLDVAMGALTALGSWLIVALYLLFFIVFLVSKMFSSKPPKWL